MSYKPQLLSADDGVIRKFHGSEDGNSFIESVQQDVGPLMRENAEIRKRTAGTRMTTLGTLIGRYPISMFEEWVRKGIITTGGKVLDEAAWAKVIHDPDTKNFRTREGRF